MDENNGQKNAVEQVADKVKDEVKSKVKNEAKKAVMDAIKPFLPGILTGVGIFFLCLLAVGVINLIPYLIKDLFNSIFGIFNKSDDDTDTTNGISQSLIYIDENSGAYKLHDGDLAQQILDELKKQGIECELIGLDKKTINKYIETEVKTTYPQTKLSQNDIDGNVIIKKTSSTGDTEQELTYKKYEDFCQMVENMDYSVLQCFSIDPDTFELCIAQKGMSITYYDANGKVVQTEGSKSEEWQIETFDYLKYVEKHSVPFNFLISLHIMSQDVDFMNEMLDMVIKDDVDEQVVLTYVETSYRDETNITYSGEISYHFSQATTSENQHLDTFFQEWYKNGIEVKSSILEEEFLKEKSELNNRTDTTSDVSGYLEETPEYYRMVIQNSEGELYVTKADTWLKYFNKDISSSGNGQSNSVSEPMNTVESTILYVQPVKVTKNNHTWADFYYKKATITINKNINTTYTPVKFTLTETENELRVDDFVSLIQKYSNVENNLTTAPSNLFYLLQQNENTQTHEQIMRYVMYKLLDIDYGVNEGTLEDLLTEYEFVEYSGVSNLRTYLMQFSFGIGYKAPMSSDGNFYKMFCDGVGWPTIGNGDLQWKSNYKQFQKPGKVMHNGQIIETANIANYINENFLNKDASESENGKSGPDAKYTRQEIIDMDIYIEKDIVDEIGDKVIQYKYDYVIEQTTDLKLSTQQIYALVAIAHNFGSLPERGGRTFKQVYEDGIEAGYEEKSWEHNRYVWDNWWCRLNGGESGHVIARDEQFETYVKGTIDFSLSEYGWLNNRQYMYYTNEQLVNLKNGMVEGNSVPYMQIMRSDETEEELFTTEEFTGEYIESHDQPYISGYYKSTTGRTFTILNQGLIGADPWNSLFPKLNDEWGPGWARRCNRAACSIIASGFSNQTSYELIYTMNNEYKDANDIPGDEYWDKYKLKLTKLYAGDISAQDFKEVIRNQLRKGGYIAFWVNRGAYIGESKRQWTSGIHWMAIIDYKIEDGEEKMVVADASGAHWVGIGEFWKGVNAYALIDIK